LIAAPPESNTAQETRTLATAKRSRVSIHGQPCKILLTCSLITMQNLVFVSHTVCLYVGGPHRPWDGRAPPPRSNMLLPHVLCQISSF